jgi:hypothetical protein
MKPKYYQSLPSRKYAAFFSKKPFMPIYGGWGGGGWRVWLKRLF